MCNQLKLSLAYVLDVDRAVKWVQTVLMCVWDIDSCRNE
jgi:hypothetical protein